MKPSDRLLAAGGGLMLWGAPKALDSAAVDMLYATPLPPPSSPMRMFHLGHSLVGRDMPAMLQQLDTSIYRLWGSGWGELGGGSA